MRFEQLDLDELRCKACGNTEDFLVEYHGTCVVHAYKDDTPDWENPNEDVTAIECLNCGTTIFKEEENLCQENP